ncbi:MAG: hypothetical protein HYX27_00965 [Acidobacteria bacterium]|nr:hypothetical protein [Acidobacteriota bacterium]
MPLQPFPGLDEYSRVALRRLASNWRESPTRPSVAGSDAIRWHSTVEDWVRDRNMPLLIRRPRCGRGCEITHRSGRMLVPADNSAAMYMLSLAMERREPSLHILRNGLLTGRMPVAVSLTGQERRQARYTGTVSEMDAPNLFGLGYAVCHVTQVGLRRVPIEDRTEIELIAHSLLFLSPLNMFVVPKEYAGLGELPEFIDEMDDVRAFAAYRN